MEAEENNNNNNNSTSLRVASFSCYLDNPSPLSSSGRHHRHHLHLPSAKTPVSIKFSKPDSLSFLNTGDNFGFEVPGPIQDPTCAFTFSNQQIPNSKDGEISIFGADKYFNMDYPQTQPSKQQQPKHMTITDDPKLPNSTPSVHSEASSWNTQSALISNPQTTSVPQIRHKKVTGRINIFTGFGCKGPCFDKEAIHIKPTIDKQQNSAAKKAQILDESRPSIEVFGSGTTSKRSSDIATNMERKLSMLTWDAIPKGKTLPSSSTTICDDMGSEASSDLFEIENLSGSIHPLLGDDITSPTSHYAPSEASIQWSVVTASAADYSIDEPIAGDVGIKTPKTRSGGGMGGLLLGCKNQKSVDVAENVSHKSKNHQLVDLSVPFGKSKDIRGMGKTIDKIKMPTRSFGNNGGLSS